jgi:hypothetical protein
MNSLNTYLTQLDALAETRGVDIKQALAAENIATTTLMRWRKGETHPSEKVAVALFERMRRMKGRASP